LTAFDAFCYSKDKFNNEPITIIYMSDASSIRKASTLPAATGNAASSIRFYQKELWLATGLNYVPQGRVVVGANIPSTTDVVDQTIFIADRPYEVLAMSEVHSTAGTDGSAVTAAVMKCTGTQAAASGTLLQGAGTSFNLKGTANTVQNSTLSATASTLKLATGDRIAVDITGVTTALVGAYVQVVLRPI
jgi:hypothetical protein